MSKKIKKYEFPEEASDVVSEAQIPLYFTTSQQNKGTYNLLSLFSGCGGMDLGFEGQFIANKKSFPTDSSYIEHEVNSDWVLLRKTRFNNDILPEL